MTRRTLLLLLLGLLPGCALRNDPAAPWLERFADADTVRVEAIAPGVHHVYVWISGQAVHVIEVDRRRCEPLLAALKAGPPLEARARTSVLGRDAIAAINADFFMTPGGTPVGAHVHDGRVVVGPGLRPVLALDASGRYRAAAARLTGSVSDRDGVRVVQVNRPLAGDRHHPPRAGLTLFDHWFGPSAPADSPSRTVRVRRVAHRGGKPIPAEWGVVDSTAPPGAPVGLDSMHIALQSTGAGATRWLDQRTPGDTLRWAIALGFPESPNRGRWHPAVAVEAVGGFPLLVAQGRGVYDEQEGVVRSFGERRHPRTAVGWDEDRLVWVVVDGRQPPYALGMTLPELEALFLRLDVTDAINLDGGGSSTMVIRGRVVNRPSDDDGERPVGNALAIRGCRSP